jgi:hypothetical protein
MGVPPHHPFSFGFSTRKTIQLFGYAPWKPPGFGGIPQLGISSKGLVGESANCGYPRDFGRLHIFHDIFMIFMMDLMDLSMIFLFQLIIDIP